MEVSSGCQARVFISYDTNATLGVDIKGEIGLMSPNNNSDPVIDALEKQLRSAEEKLGDQLQLSVDRCQKALKSEKEKLTKGKEAVKAAKLRLRYAKGNNTQLARAKRSLDNIEAKQALLEASHEEAKQAAKLTKHELGRFQAAQKAVAQVDKEAGMGDSTAKPKATSAKKAAAKSPKANKEAAKAAPKKAAAKKTAAKSSASTDASESSAKAPAKKAAAKKAPAKAAAKPAASEPAAAPAPAPKKAAKPRKPEPEIERTVPPPSQTTTPKGKKDRLRSLFDAID